METPEEADFTTPLGSWITFHANEFPTSIANLVKKNIKICTYIFLSSQPLEDFLLYPETKKRVRFYLTTKFI